MIEFDKLKIGDKVWLIDGNKVEEKEITGIYKAKEGWLKNIYAYNFLREPKEYDWKPEGKLYSTKEELIASI